jgi:hypothetical protein
LTEALAAAAEKEIRFYEAETHWLKGELLLKRQAERSGAEQMSPRGAAGVQGLLERLTDRGLFD